MGCRSLLTSTALVASLGLAAMPALAQNAAAEGRVLADPATGFNPDAVRGMISRGDAAAGGWTGGRNPFQSGPRQGDACG